VSEGGGEVKRKEISEEGRRKRKQREEKEEKLVP